MIDPIVPFLALIAAALMMVGSASAVMPAGVVGFLTTGLGGLGVLLCLPQLVFSLPRTQVVVPIGPPGFSFHLALDPLSNVFLLLVLLCGTSVAGCVATGRRADVAALGLGGIVLALLAADAFSLGIGLAVANGAIFLDRADRFSGTALLTPLLLIAAVCLITPSGAAPSFQAILAASIDPVRGIAASVLTLIGVSVWLRRPPGACVAREALIAGALLPTGSYLLLRIIAGLCGPAERSWWALPLLLLGSALALAQAWGAARQPDTNGSVAALVRRQAGLVVIGVGLIVLARTADLPQAQSLAMAATLLLSFGGALGGTLATLAAHTIKVGAGTNRLARLGGLVHLMPATSAGLAASLLTLAALPPGLGFTCMWLSLQAILAEPRTGGVLAQLPLALAAASIAFSAAICSAACVRLIGIAVLGRPRTPRGAGATEAGSQTRWILLGLGGAVLLAGVFPGITIRALSAPTMRAITGVAALPQVYPALPLIALFATAIVIIWLLQRGKPTEICSAGLWNDGMPTPYGLDFGDPAAQANGAGFVPALPALPQAALSMLPQAALSKLPQPALPRVPVWPEIRQPSVSTGLWCALIAFGLLLLLRAVTG